VATPTEKRGTDWVEARDVWLAQDRPRSYERIAQQFGVSGARVRYVAKRDKWLTAAEDVDRELLRKAQQRIVRSRADRVTKVLGIVDAALDEFDSQLVEKAREARLRDMSELVKLGELLLGEATDRVSFGELQEALGVIVALAVEYVPDDARAEFLERVRAAGSARSGRRRERSALRRQGLP
jgi:hypothetical protein